MTTEELWQATLAQVQFQLSPANFATWFKNTYILSRKEGMLIISVPNNFSREWLENKYNKIIFRIIKNLDNDIKEIPKEIGQLKQLLRLNLWWNNDIKEIPKEMRVAALVACILANNVGMRAAGRPITIASTQVPYQLARMSESANNAQTTKIKKRFAC